MASGSLVSGTVELATPFTGTFLLEDGESLCSSIESGDWVSGGMAAFSGAMDGISMAVDPIGSLIAAGLGWLMEHLEPLRGWLNDLTGDAGEVAGFAMTWMNISRHLGTASADLDKSLARLEGFKGQAGDAFAAFHSDVAKHLTAAGKWSAAISTGMELASMIVKMVHDLTRDAVAMIVGTAISAGITAAATLGTGAPAAAAQVAAKAASLAGKIGKFVIRLISSITKLGSLVDDLVKLFDRLMSVVAGALHKGGQSSRDSTSVVASPASVPDTARTATITEDDLSAGQLANLTRYLKKLPAGAELPVITRGPGGSIHLSSKVPGNVPGSYATYDKSVDSTGETTGYTKTTVDPSGKIVHVKEKFIK